MTNEMRAYNSNGEFVAAYGLGWNIADIMRNQHNLADKVVERVDLTIDGKVTSSVTRTELKKALCDD